MKKVLFFAVLATAFMSSCGTSSTKMATTKDSVAYAVGMDLGGMIKPFDSTLNIDIIAQAMKDVMAGKEAITQEDAQRVVMGFAEVKRAEADSLNKIKVEANKKAGEEFLAKIKAENANAVTTESGLVYEIIEQGGEKPAAEDEVQVNYKGTLPDGKVFDESPEGQPVKFQLNGVIAGWTEGIQLVGKGGKIKLWIPGELAYGERGAGGGMIGPNQTLVFEVELLDIVKAGKK